MRAFDLRYSLTIAAVSAVLAFGGSASADDAGSLEPFGGSAYPGLLINSDIAELTTSAPAQTPVLLAQIPVDEINDPLEPVNRFIFGFNEGVYTIVFKPIAKTYNKIFPDTFRLAVSNLIDHIASPVTLVNDLLQLEFDRAMTTVARFTVNTIGGMGGIADVADSFGLKAHKEDFGQTLGSFGVGEGFYLVIPLLGPSNPRDAVGKFLVDPYFDPLGMWLSNTDRDSAAYARLAVGGLDEYAGIYEELDQIKKTSVDFYAAVRSLYRQKRATLISNGREEDLPAIPNYDLNFGTDNNGSLANIK